MKVLSFLIMFCLFSCSTAGVFSPLGFSFYKDVREPVLLGANDSTKKMGEACGYNVLGFYSFGDISTKKAMENGGIKKVSVVDRHTFAILTLFAKVCTEVSGE